jgi:hypothetical protein
MGLLESSRPLGCLGLLPLERISENRQKPLAKYKLFGDKLLEVVSLREYLLSLVIMLAVYRINPVRGCREKLGHCLSKTNQQFRNPALMNPALMNRTREWAESHHAHGALREKGLRSVRWRI